MLLGRSLEVTRNVKQPLAEQVDEMIPALLSAVLPKASCFLLQTFELSQSGRRMQNRLLFCRQLSRNLTARCARLPTCSQGDMTESAFEGAAVYVASSIAFIKPSRFVREALQLLLQTLLIKAVFGSATVLSQLVAFIWASGKCCAQSGHCPLGQCRPEAACYTVNWSSTVHQRRRLDLRQDEAFEGTECGCLEAWSSYQQIRKATYGEEDDESQ